MAGINQTEFWDYTLAEILRQIKVFNKLNKIRTREQMTYNYNLAAMIVSFLGSSLNGKKIPSFEQLYPDLDIEEEVIDTNKNDEYFLAQMIEFQANSNKQRKSI